MIVRTQKFLYINFIHKHSVYSAFVQYHSTECVSASIFFILRDFVLNAELLKFSIQAPLVSSFVENTLSSQMFSTNSGEDQLNSSLKYMVLATNYSQLPWGSCSIRSTSPWYGTPWHTYTTPRAEIICGLTLFLKPETSYPKKI